MLAHVVRLAPCPAPPLPHRSARRPRPPVSSPSFSSNPILAPRSAPASSFLATGGESVRSTTPVHEVMQTISFVLYPPQGVGGQLRFN